ncbi:MAG: hypothetical protein IH933_16115 [Euryarchaeota archaeon]|nr:hypothetical protein [Euryarchaeota archaeon]
MNRRSVVRYCGLLAVGSVAGCIDPGLEIISDDTDDEMDEGESDERGPNDAEPDAEEQDDERTEIETSFEVHSVDCGSGEDHAEVTVENDTVVVDGVIRGENGCYSADLSAASIDEDRLRIEVESHEDTDEELCTQCLTDVVYEAAITISDEYPSRIVVEHDGSNVVRSDLR